ncbi:MAG: M50 family metallopeptidase [Patescibacteria group bacterium]
MMFLEVAIVFIVLILLLVASHELGHFLTAKWFGVRVDEFGLGIPPKIFGYQWGETLYSLNLLPVGGFVRIFGEEEDVADPRSFSSKSFLVRSTIVAAGVIANVVVAFLIFTTLAWLGTSEAGVQIQDIAGGSPAAVAGLKAGDFIIGIGDDNAMPNSVDEVHAGIEAHRGVNTAFRIQRGQEQLTLHITPRKNIPEGQGALGIVISEVGFLPVVWYKAPWAGLKMTYFGLKALVVGLIGFFAQLFSSGTAPGEVIGPVGIAFIARQSFSVGIGTFLQLLAFLSLNLAIINILPIPALDGGRIFFFVIEKLTGRPIPARVSSAIHSVFFLLLLIFFIWVTSRDILNYKQYLKLFRIG